MMAFLVGEAPAQNALPSFNDSLSAGHTQARLILSAEVARPGDTVWAGVDLKMEPGWHTYWKNSGAAGMPTKIQWHLPPGVTAGPVQWPLPEKFPPAEVTTYGYENEAVLLVPLTLAGNLPPGPLNLKANVSWLECSAEVCVPDQTNLEATLTIGGVSKNSEAAALLETWRKKIPQPATNCLVRAWWQTSAGDDTRPLVVAGNFTGVLAGAPPTVSDFYPAGSDAYELQAATEKLSLAGSDFAFRKIVKKFSGDWPKEISGVLVTEADGQRRGYEITVPVGEQPGAGALSVSPASGPPPVTGTVALPLMLLYAFIGGLILNIMPCVLPVIALKILGFVSEARSEPRRVRNLGFIYALGVLVSFLALAAVVIGLKAAGRHAGWGMQFGSPIFIVCLTTLVTLVALNLFGVFEVTAGGKILDAAGQLASRHGAPGAFFNGVLATVLATPCTAPVLATALGFAFLQNNPAIILLIFLFVGLGLAAPYVILSCSPAWLKFLPRPGPWMEQFKKAMGFPMLATAVWLFNLAYDDYGKGVFWLGMFLVGVALAAWVFGEFVQRGRAGKSVAWAVVVILLAGDYVFALEKGLHWRTAVPEMTTDSFSRTAGGIAWQPWSPQAVAAARAAGHPVLVDFTADWCVTCNVNRKIAIEVPSVENKLKELGVVTLVGDYTHFPDRITAELNRFHRAGVPLVLVYPKNPEAQPIVLPQLLTPGIVVEALDRAAR
ncbi:MAG TPA: protein-disulfide reductase DsbD domain-containing protein [Verrucomicrobiae bacterium]|nr:protein-disulfide reductase DsbD domain-containing protein [Verrucomicrobiae bacterium]